MDELSTPALAACLAAVWRETDRLEALAFGPADLSGRAGMIGHYRIDLSIALDTLSDEYAARRGDDSSLESLEDLKAFYAKAD